MHFLGHSFLHISALAQEQGRDLWPPPATNGRLIMYCNINYFSKVLVLIELAV